MSVRVTIELSDDEARILTSHAVRGKATFVKGRELAIVSEQPSKRPGGNPQMYVNIGAMLARFTDPLL